MTVEELAEHILKLAGTGHVQEAHRAYNEALVAVPRHPVLVPLLDKLPLQYDGDFYATSRPRSLQSARLLFGLLAPHLVVRSVVDFGAGTGTWLEAACLGGADVALGIEGRWVEQSPLRFTGAAYRFQDLNETVVLDQRFDLAISVEVAEHLQPNRGPTFIDDLCRASDHVLFGAALPRQLGEGHINCRPHSYWVAEFERNGFYCLDAFRPAVWYDPRVDPWYAQNCFLFAKKDSPLMSILPPAALLDVYHPMMVSKYVLRDHQTGMRNPVA
jgi:hypothetical protein